MAKLKFYGGFCELKRLREALGLMQSQVAAQVGITTKYYSRLETGGYYSHKKLKIIRRFLQQYSKQKALDFNSLKIMRLRADLTQKQVARWLDIDQSTYSKIERGERPTPRVRHKARKLLQEIINDLEAKK